jgi:hypothetical protein
MRHRVFVSPRMFGFGRLASYDYFAHGGGLLSAEVGHLSEHSFAAILILRQTEILRGFLSSKGPGRGLTGMVLAQARDVDELPVTQERGEPERHFLGEV